MRPVTNQPNLTNHTFRVLTNRRRHRALWTSMSLLGTLLLGCSPLAQDNGAASPASTSAPDSPIALSDLLAAYDGGGISASDSSIALNDALAHDAGVVPPPSVKRPLPRKGMDAAPFDIYRDLNVTQVKLNIVLNSVFSKRPAPGTVSFDYRGKTYYYRGNVIQTMDNQLQLFHDQHPMDVAFVILVGCDKEFILPEAMVDQNCDRKKGIFFMPEVATDEGARSFEAMMYFLTERYAKVNSDRVPVVHWILHNEVDAQWVWTHAGQKSLNEFMSLYVKTLKITSALLDQFNKDATPYVSLTRHWNTSHKNDPTKYYKPIDVLRWLYKHDRIHGSFNWGIAQHPYGDSPWNVAQDIAFDLNTPAISMANLEVLDELVACEQLRFRGQPRKIILSEQGFTSNRVNTEAAGGPAFPGMHSGEESQAASLLYAMAKMPYLKNVYAFHYHRYQDHPDEGSAFGLLRANGTEKLAYRIYKQIEPDSSNVFSPSNEEFQNLWRTMGINVNQAATNEQRKGLLIKNVKVDCSLMDQ